jgi:prepilin-type N-terminal cleavage/methylation domain-containing protein
LFIAVERGGGAFMKNVHRITGWSLMELLCVMLIISILAAIYLGVMARALRLSKKSLADFSCRHREPALTC